MKARDIKPGDYMMLDGETYYTVKTCFDQWGTTTARVVYTDNVKRGGFRYWLSDDDVELTSGPGHYTAPPETEPDPA